MDHKVKSLKQWCIYNLQVSQNKVSTLKFLCLCAITITKNIIVFDIYIYIIFLVIVVAEKGKRTTCFYFA